MSLTDIEREVLEQLSRGLGREACARESSARAQEQGQEARKRSRAHRIGSLVVHAMWQGCKSCAQQTREGGSQCRKLK